MCNVCGVEKDLSLFNIRSDTGKHKRKCRDCENEWHKVNYTRIRSRKLASAKARYNTPDVKTRVKAYRASRKHLDKVWKKDWDLSRNYGITLQSFYEIIELQHYSCPVCRKHLPPNSRLWCVDHDHATEKIRGIICLRCNHMLGHAKDDPDTLRRGAAYLEKHTWSK